MSRFGFTNEGNKRGTIKPSSVGGGADYQEWLRTLHKPPIVTNVQQRDQTKEVKPDQPEPPK